MKRIHPSLILFITAVLAYGTLIPQLGFYWDDMAMSWIRYELGPEAMTRYFSTNRPVWGLLYQLTTFVIPHNPVYWQIFALIWRWLGAVVVWLCVRELWKDKPRFALAVALLFLLYPGFNQQWASFLYSHFFIVLFFFLFSFHLMLRRKTVAALVFSALSLWMMEYFFVLELARIGVIWISLRDAHPVPRDRIKPSLRLWMPYLAVFALAVLSRIFIFNNQVYGFGLTEKLRSAPFETLKSLGESMLLSLRLVLRDSWMQAFRLPDPMIEGSLTTTIYYIVVVGTILVSGLGVLLASQAESRAYLKDLRDNAYAIGLGVLAVFLAGWPFWLIGFQPSLAWPASRFTLPFMFGVSLIFAGVISLIPWQSLRYIIIVSLIGLAAGIQFLWSNEYRRDWVTQKNLFWQLNWRAPGIEPGTLVLMNEGALEFYADNSLSAALNWIYAPEGERDQIDFVLFYPTTRLRNSLPKLEPGIPIAFDYIAAEFHGNTSHTLSMYFAPPGCLRILDPEIERANRLIPEPSLMRFAARISSPELIVNEQRAKMPEVYGPEPVHGWCYYFQKADLARQFGNWEDVVKLGDAAFALNDYPNDPIERFVFIEGYAHMGEWDRALELSNVSYRVSKDYVGPPLCRLWERIETESTGGMKRSGVLSEVKRIFACNP